MLSRRIFAGCLLCVGMELVAADADAQTAPGFTRTILGTQDLGGTNYQCVQVMVAIDPGALVARHTHPGIEAGVVLAGSSVLSVRGEADRVIKASDGFLIPPEVPHAVRNGPQPTRVISTYTVERGKPLATPAPE